MNKKRSTTIGIFTIILALFVLAFIITFSIYTYTQSSKNTEETLPDSLYISEDVNILDSNPTVTEETIDEGTPEIKQGEIKTDENRHILSTGDTLTEDEILDLEERYDIEFTSDTPENGVYVINTTDESQVEDLSEELDASLETDVPIKMSTDQIDWGVSRIGANQVWNSASGTGVIVAIIDTGIELTHSDLSSRVTTGYDFVNNDSNPTDDNGHGTHVAGIVASTSNESGTVGVANTTTLMPVKVLNNQGYGYLSDVAKGIYYAADHGAKVINLSLGTTYDSSTLKSAIQYAANKGVFIAAAAGNASASACEYPAAYSYSMCVVATDSNNKLASFSNTGGEIAAPGVSNYSTYINGTYRYMSGTSMATPHIAGAAAVIFSYCKDCSSSDVRALIKSTAVDLGNIGIDSVFGAGLVDLVAAIDSLTQEEATATPPEETPTTTEPQTQIQGQNGSNPSIKQTIKITEPQVDERQKRYTAKTEEDITVKFTLDPISSGSSLKKIVLSINNQDIYETVSQSGEYTISKDLLDHSQQVIKVTAIFADGGKVSDSILINSTYLKYKSLSTRDRDVLGISTFVGFERFLMGW